MRLALLASRHRSSPHFIPGGGGIGRTYNALFEHLDHKFTVCAYDRRQSGLSKVQEPKMLNPAQQCRDIIAIAKALGHQKTSIFANSGGALISFQFAVSYPEYLEHLIAHEAPTTALLDDAAYHLDRTFMLYDTYKKNGVMAAMQAFVSALKGLEDGPLLSGLPISAEDEMNFWEYEFLTFTIYCPDLLRIVENAVSIAVAVGLKSGDAFYARTTVHQAKILGCPRYFLLGHHIGFEAEASEFAPRLIAVLDEMERKKSH